MIVLCTGSRSIVERLDQKDLVDQAFKILLEEAQQHGLDDVVSLIKHGDARGTDFLCDQWAKQKGVPALSFPAKWDYWRDLPKEKIKLKQGIFGAWYNSLAGFNRNQEMLESGFDVGLAIRMPGLSRGTDDMKNRIIKSGKPLLMYYVDTAYEWL